MTLAPPPPAVDLEPAPTRRLWSGLGWEVALVLVAFLLSQLVMGLAAQRAGVSATDIDSFIRWDSGHYIGIAHEGYKLAPCPPSETQVAGSTEWCGNSAWFPGLPWAMRAVSQLGFDHLSSGVLIARVCHLAMLAVLWFGLLRDRRRSAAALALGIAAVFPAAVYQDALFPVSMASLAIVASLALLSRQRFLAAGLAGAVAALSYSTGVFLALSGAAAILLFPQPLDRRARIRAVAQYATPIVAAWCFVLLVFEWSTGRWNAWFLAQEHYHYEKEIFVAGAFERLQGLWSAGNAIAPPLQSVLVTALMIACLFVVARGWRQREARDVALATFGAVFWIVPLSLGGYGALPRAEALLVPVAALTVRLPRWAQLALLVAFVPLAIEMGALFFDWTLV
jgi:hypothetical protein